METDAQKLAGRFLAVSTSLLEFTDRHIHGIMLSVVAMSPKDRENCVLALYFRAYADLKTTTRVKGVQDVQTVARIARALLEYVVDLRLLDVIPDSVPKMIAFIDVQKLKSATSVSTFKKAYPNSKIDATIFDEFITKNEAAIRKAQDSLWPGAKRVEHWSLLNMSDRCKKLGQQFEQWYEVGYRRMNWHVHSGLTGFANVSLETLHAFGADALVLISQTYCELLAFIIREFKIDRAIGKIDNLMKFATIAPFAGSEREAQTLWDELIS